MAWQSYDAEAYTAAQRQQELDRQRREEDQRQRQRAENEQRQRMEEDARRRQAAELASWQHSQQQPSFGATSSGTRSSYRTPVYASDDTTIHGTFFGYLARTCWRTVQALRSAVPGSPVRQIGRGAAMGVLLILTVICWTAELTMRILQFALIVIRAFAQGWAGVH